MKTTRLTYPRLWGATAILGACALVMAPVGAPRAMSAEEKETPTEIGGGLLAPLQQWQQKMSESFRNTFDKLGVGGGTPAPGSVSVDFREQHDSYMLRMNLPNRDLEKMDVGLEGDRVRIVAAEEGEARRYEQTIVLGDVPADAKARVERHQADHMIVVTVPKKPASSSSSATAATPPETRKDAPPPFFHRDRDIMNGMDRMRRDMDRIFEDAFSSFKLLPGYSGWFDEYRFASSYEIKEEGGNYVVRAYLPDRNMDNVAVNVEGQILHIDAQAEDSQAAPKKGDVPGKAEKVHRAQYTQRVTLPGPVDALKMKVERKEHMLVVTLPKAKNP